MYRAIHVLYYSIYSYTTGPRELINLLRQRSRPYLFSNTLPPPVVAGASKVRVAGSHYHIQFRCNAVSSFGGIMHNHDDSSSQCECGSTSLFEQCQKTCCV